MLLAFLLAILAAGPHETLAACAWVRAENDGAGTGFIVDVKKRLLVTCRHVVADRTKVDVIFPWFRDGELVTSRAEYLRNRVHLRELGLLVTGTVLKKSDDLDLALVELESLPSGAKAATFSSSAPMPGKALTVIGNRLDLETMWNVTMGPTRAMGRLADGYFWRGRKLAANAEVVIGQLPTDEGDSGGPVFDSNGAVVGMASALRRQCPLAAVCIPAASIRAFAGLPDPPQAKPRLHDVAEALTRATVWVRPTATDIHLAGVLIEKDFVLTIGKGLASGDRVGIALPIREGDRWQAERAAYRDPLTLALSGHWRSGTVLAQDASRDLALIRLDSPATQMRPLALATHRPAAGDSIHTMNHPGGLEFAWVYAAGVIRQHGRIAIAAGDRARPIDVLLCQIPAQFGSPGGAVVNDKGELLGLVCRKESTQLVGYAVTADEIADFLDTAFLDRPARTLAGLLARIEAIPGRFAAGTARGLAQRAVVQRQAGRVAEAERDARAAIALDSGSVPARICLAKLLEAAGNPSGALAELDAAVEKGPFERGVLVLRAELAGSSKDWRKARGDLERVLDADPADAEARQRLAGVHLELGDDVKAAAAIADTLRADPKRLVAVATDLLAQAGSLAKKYPDAPAIAADWLAKALSTTKRAEFAPLLKTAANAKDDAERLAILRAGIAKLAGK